MPDQSPPVGPCRPFELEALATDPCPTCGHPIYRHTMLGPYCVDCEVTDDG